MEGRSREQGNFRSELCAVKVRVLSWGGWVSFHHPVPNLKESCLGLAMHLESGWVQMVCMEPDSRVRLSYVVLLLEIQLDRPLTRGPIFAVSEWGRVSLKTDCPGGW